MAKAPESTSPQPETAAVESAAAQRASAGELLRQAREGKGLSVAAIATQMNLDIRTVEALERDDRDKLPAPIFVRGYLRSFARLVGASEAEVLAAYQAQAPAEPVPHRVGMARPARPVLRLPRIPWGGIFTAVLVLGLVYVGFSYGPAMVARMLSDTPDDATAVLPLPAPGDEAGVQPGELVTAPAPGTGSDTLALPLPPPAAIEADTPPADTVPELPEVQETEILEPELQADTDFAADGTAVEAAAAEPGQMRLVLRFSDDSWVEIRAADGSKLLFGLMRAGASHTLEGRAPISLLLGNARAVSLSVDGAPYDLQPHTRGQVARFKLTEPR